GEWDIPLQALERAAGPAEAGKLMFRQGSDALMVTKIRHSRGNLLVMTKPAGLRDPVQSGRISFAGRPDVRQAFLSRTTAPGGAHAADACPSPQYPYVQGSRRRTSAASTPPLSIVGGEGAFGYQLGFTPVSSTRMNLDGALCFGNGSI